VHLFSNYQQSSSGAAFVIVFPFPVSVAYKDLAEFHKVSAKPADAFLPDDNQLKRSLVFRCFRLHYRYASHSPYHKTFNFIT